MSLTEQLNQAGFNLLIPTVYEGEKVTIIASAGQTMWKQIQISQWAEDENPVDTYSRSTIIELLQKQKQKPDLLWGCWEKQSTTSLCIIESALNSGIVHQSPLRIHIHREFGLWFAYRAVISGHLTPLHEETPSPCNTCETKECISQCPTNAVKEETFDLNLCGPYRTSENSSCFTQCMSRKSCPVGKKYQYSEEQQEHHHFHANQIISKYRTKMIEK